MSSNNCTCKSTCTKHESITKNGQTIEKAITTESSTDPSGKVTIKTTETDTTIDPEGHKTITTHTTTGKDATPAVDFENDDFDADFERMKAKMDADMKNFENDHPALK